MTLRDILRLFPLGLALWLPGWPAAATPYPVMQPGDTVIGQIAIVHARAGETLPDVARENGLGFMDIKLANPNVDTWLPPASAEIVLPTEFVLPTAPHDGIILNIPEMRLYYFPKPLGNGVPQVLTYPIGIGREGWATPYVTTRVTSKQANPSWYPPESIREEHAAEGDPLPKRVAPGPDNPLGAFAMKLSLPSYLIHGTNKPWGVGMRVSHGCIRLYPEDIEKLFKLVPRGTPVHIVNQPYKVGLRGNRIFLEAHPYLDEDAERFAGNLTSVVKMIVALTGDRPYHVDWDRAKQTIDARAGIPVEIGRLEDQNLHLAGEGHAPVDSAGTTEGRLDLQLDTQLPPAGQ